MTIRFLQNYTNHNYTPRLEQSQKKPQHTDNQINKISKRVLSPPTETINSEQTKKNVSKTQPLRNRRVKFETRQKYIIYTIAFNLMLLIISKILFNKIFIIVALVCLLLFLAAIFVINKSNLNRIDEQIRRIQLSESHRISEKRTKRLDSNPNKYDDQIFQTIKTFCKDNYVAEGCALNTKSDVQKVMRWLTKEAKTHLVSEFLSRGLVESEEEGYNKLNIPEMAKKTRTGMI